jgi:hypothetical protein
LGTAAGLAPRAHAAEPIAVEDLIRQGVKLRHEGRDIAALPLFQRAYDLEPSPRTAAQLGMVELTLGYFLAAERHLMEALASPRHPWVYRNRAQIELTLREARASIATLEIVGTPAGAEVTVNGKAAGTLPLLQSVRVPEGVVQVTVRAPGFDEKSTSVKIAGGKNEKLTVTLSPSVGQHAAAVRDGAGKPASSGGPPPPPRVARPGAPVEAQAAAEPPGNDGKSSAPAWVRPASWVAGGLAVTAFGLGGYNLWRMQQNQNAFNTRKRPGTEDRACSVNFKDYGEGGCAALRNQTISAQRLGLAALQAGGLLTALSIVGFLWSADSGHETALGPTGAVATVEPDGGLSAGWRFRF